MCYVSSAWVQLCWYMVVGGYPCVWLVLCGLNRMFSVGVQLCWYMVVGGYPCILLAHLRFFTSHPGLLTLLTVAVSGRCRLLGAVGPINWSLPFVTLRV